MNESCSFSQCGRPVRSLGLCRSHYENQRLGKALVPLRKKRASPEPCAFDGCDRTARGHGLCQPHNVQRRNGRPLAPVEPRQPYQSSRQRDERGNKQCRRCHAWLPVESFSPDTTKSDGLVQWCRPCAARYKTEWRYGLEVGQVDVMLRDQDGRCAICTEPFNDSRRFYVDHDHYCCPGKTSCGKCVRGLLCNLCNIVAGFLDQENEAARFHEYIASFRS